MCSIFNQSTMPGVEGVVFFFNFFFFLLDLFACFVVVYFANS